MKEKLFQHIITPLWAQSLQPSAATSGGLDMPFRKAISKAIQNGRKVLKSIFHKTEKVVVPEVPRVFTVPEKVKVVRLSLQRVLFDGIFPKVSVRTLAAELRRRAALQGISSSLRPSANGRHLPLFAFIGVGIAANENIHNKSQLNICANIRHIVQKFDIGSAGDEVKKPSAYSLEDLEFGSFIEKGCNAAVYEARYVHNYKPEEDINNGTDYREQCDTVVPPCSSVNGNTTITDEVCGQLHLTRTEDSEFDDIEILSIPAESGDFTVVEENDVEFEFVGAVADQLIEKEGLYLVVDDGSSDIMVLCMDEEDDFEVQDEENPEIDKASDFNLAVKIMFNYDAESNILSISQAMRKETIPAKTKMAHHDTSLFLNREDVGIYLPPHPNIVDMKEVFVGNVPDLPDATSKYPAALPHRLYQNGLGRNMTMFLVMKRYTSTLREYLAKHDLDMSTRLLLLTQLLEGVEHLTFNGIAHRDLKSNNILIDEDTDDGKPRLVISDFGCCLADKENGLKIPYMSCEQPKGGNPSLMAPEIACAVPSRSGRAMLDYSKSDLWAVGSLAYEIFGLENPFYAKTGNQGLVLISETYRTSDLPSLPDTIPGVIQQLIYNMLTRDPEKRLPPSRAATIIQLYLWNQDTMSFKNLVSVNDIKSAILLLTLEVIAKKIFKSENELELELKCTLLKRLTEADLNECVIFFCDNI